MKREVILFVRFFPVFPKADTTHKTKIQQNAAHLHRSTHPDRVLLCLSKALHQPNRSTCTVRVATNRPTRRVAIRAAPCLSGSALGHHAQTRPQARQMEGRRAGATKQERSRSLHRLRQSDGNSAVRSVSAAAAAAFSETLANDTCLKVEACTSLGGIGAASVNVHVVVCFDEGSPWSCAEEGLVLHGSL